MSYPNNDSIQYMKSFGKSLINPYRMLQSFFAVVFLKGCTKFSCDLQEWFYQQKVKDEYRELLLPMYFRNNGAFYYSTELNEAISMLFMVGLIRKGGTPSNFGIIFLEYSNEIAKQILGEIHDKKVLKLINTLADQFFKDVIITSEDKK